MKNGENQLRGECMRFDTRYIIRNIHKLSLAYNQNMPPKNYYLNYVTHFSAIINFPSYSLVIKRHVTQ